MKIFLAHSFSEESSELVKEVQEFLEATGHEYISGEKPESSGVSDKVKKRIDECNIFLGIFNQEEKIYKVDPEDSDCYIELGYTTSNWVIQESGYAIGKNKKTIFLIEKELYKFPGLQGDLEVVRFESSAISKSFTRISQMIKFLESGKRSEKENYRSISSDEDDDAKIELSQNIEKPLKEEKLESKIFNAIFKEKDYVKAREIYKKQIDSIKEEERDELKAKILRHCHSIGDPNALDELKRFNENKDNYKINFQLAMRYKDMEEYQIAKEEFLKITEGLDLTIDDELKYYLYCYIEAGFCLASDNQCDIAYELLSKLLSKTEFQKLKAIILFNLFNIAEKCNDSDKMIIYGELSLDIDPGNPKLRFNVAMEHSKLLNNKLSLLHYKKLINTSESDGMNNLGVQYEALDMMINSIKCYSKASNYKDTTGTIAMANLANLYLKAGFIDDGEILLNDANSLAKEGVEIHSHVGVVKARIEGLIKGENIKEKIILKDAEEERKFRVRYSNAFILNNNNDTKKLNGLWKIESLDIELIFKDNEFKINETFIKEDDNSNWSRFVSEEEKKYSKIKNIKINGKLENLAGKYTIKIEEKGKYGTILNSYKSEGYLIIYENFKKIDVMEIKDNKMKITQWIKMNI